MKFILSVAILGIATLFFNTKANSQDLENALLWKITGNDLENPSYLFGTIHVGDARVFQYGDALPKVMNEVDAVYGEIDLLDIASQFAMMNRLMMEGTLADLLSPEDYSMLQARVQGTPASILLNKAKPFFTMAELMRIIIRSDSTTVLDMHLQLTAKALGKKVGGIETLAEQIDAVDEISLKDQADMLVQLVKEWDDQKGIYEALLEAYLNEDLNKMQQISNEEMEGEAGADMELSLLINRNKVMLNRLEKLMPEESLLFAVGALHLPAEYGLISLFRSMGYKVEPILSNRSYSPKPLELAPAER